MGPSGWELSGSDCVVSPRIWRFVNGICPRHITDHVLILEIDCLLCGSAY